MLRRLSSALALSFALTVAPSVALALDGGSSDAGADADLDAAGLDAAGLDAALDAGGDAAKDAAKDSAVPAEDGGPITFRPDADTPADDAGDLPATPVDSGCSLASSGGGTTSRHALPMVFALVLASLVARRRTRRDARKAR